MQRYDLAVAGDGIGGLATAALLARRGKRVMVISPSHAVGGELAPVTGLGITFSPGSLLCFGLGKGEPLQRLCSDLGVALNTSALSPSYQVALPDRRISVFSDVSETLEELNREFPREIDDIYRFFKDISRGIERTRKAGIMSFFSERRTAASFIGAFGFSNEFISFLDCIAQAFLLRKAEDVTLSEMYALIDTAPLAVVGGLSFLCEQLLSVVLMNGGEVRHNEAGAVVRHQNGRVAGLELNSGQLIDADAVLINMPSPDAGTSLFMEVQDDVIPLGMARQVIVLPEYGQAHGLFIVSVGEIEHAAPDRNVHRGINVLFPFRSERSADRKDLELSIGKLVPFLSEYTCWSGLRQRGTAAYRFPESVRRRAVRARAGGPYLEKASVRNLYVLQDDGRSPLNGVRGARVIEALLSR